MHAVRQESFPAGYYHLEAVTDIDGKGMQFYAKDNKQTLVAAALDARYPAQPGNLRSLSLDSVYALGLFPVNLQLPTLMKTMTIGVSRVQLHFIMPEVLLLMAYVVRFL